MIELFFWPTPNAKKITIMLEECGLPYKITPVNIGKGDQFEPDFIKISPNNRMPAIVDHEASELGAPISIFESGAILLYLAEKTGKFLSQGPREKFEAYQWVIWQMANVGPNFGQSGFFRLISRDATFGDQSFGLRRFDDEVNRLYGIWNNRLYDRRYLAGDDYTIADMASYPFALRWEALGQDIDEFKYVKRWLEDVGNRPAVGRAMSIGDDLVEDPSTLPPEEMARRMKILLNQRARPAPESGGLETPVAAQ